MRGRAMLRLRNWWALVLIAVCGALIAPWRASGAAAQGDPAAQVIELVNGYRASLGLAPLEMEVHLMAAAQDHADWMARTGAYGHTGDGGSTPTQRARLAGYEGTLIYENWMMGNGASPTDAVVWWDNSPVHQATLQLPDHDHVGVGVANNGGQPIYVLMAGKWRPPPTPTSPPSEPKNEDAGDPAAADDEPPTPKPVVVIPVTRADPQPDGSIVHRVRQGQTAWTIAAVYGVELDYLRQINQLPPNALVRPGDELIVTLAEGQSPPLSGRMHTIREGETAWTVAAYYGLTLDELLDLNDIDRGTVLVPGDELIIRPPEPTWTPAPTATATPPPPRDPVTLAPTRLPTDPPPTTAHTRTRVPVAVAEAVSATPVLGTSTPDARPAAEAGAATEDNGPRRAVILALLIGGAGMIVLAGAIGLAIGLRRG